MTFSELQAQIKKLPEDTVLIIEFQAGEELSEKRTVNTNGIGYSASEAGEVG